jgi:two-component system sensor histidine kinase and response regulator WspE
VSLDDFSLSELFRVEAQAQVAKLSDGLIALDDRSSPEQLEELMRAAHSLKGAARIVGHEMVVRLAHELEECFVAAQESRLDLTQERIDVLLRGVDALATTAAADPEVELEHAAREAVGRTITALQRLALVEAPAIADATSELPTRAVGTPLANGAGVVPAGVGAPSSAAAPDNTERLLTLSGEALVASRVLLTQTASDVTTRRARSEMDRAIAEVRLMLGELGEGVEVQRALGAMDRAVTAAVQRRRDQASALDVVARRLSDVVAQLYESVLDARMRPFGVGVAGMPRMVRDTARELGRDVRLLIIGESTPVDREVLRRIEAPLGHLVRNAVDHGVEPPEERAESGKPRRGTIRVEARHGGGRLLVSVEDDGRGIDLEAVRARVVQRGLADQAAAREMSELELSHFLFLPGFTLRDSVTAISGRGVGLDAVQTAVREIGGDVRILRAASGGTRFELQLPLTLSVVRALVVDVGGESYAVPLARVHRILRVERAEIGSVEGRQHFTLDDRQVGLVLAHQLLEAPATELAESAAVVVVGEHETALGIVVDRFVGEEELVLRGLDARLGKVQDVIGAALLADGSPTLVLDVDDLQRTATKIVAGGRLDPVRHDAAQRQVPRKRVLVVDDSLTVRELERKMIEGQGYAVDVAVDGMDAWNALRAGQYDLVVTDVDMPRMDGIELVTRIKGDATLRQIPVMIVSYKDRDEDRRRGLEAGADYYLTKGSFYDETMLRAIEDFIGGAT